jgi:hypothetical protein
LLEFYAAFVRQIESGQRSWGDSSVDLEVPILSKHVKQDFNKSNNTLKKDNKYPTVWYCFLYQKNKCSMNSPHSVMIRGVNREVRHFCATCYYKVEKIQRVHPESSSACPHFTE